MGIGGMWAHWVIDASMGWPPCLCPVELNDNGEIQTVVVGMNLISDKAPEGGRIIALVHPGGQGACDEFYNEHKSEIDAMLAENREESGRRRGEESQDVPR